MAEWLRREIRNLMGSARVGSNPAAVAISHFYFFVFFFLLNKYFHWYLWQF